MVLPLAREWLAGLGQCCLIDGIALRRKDEVHLTLLDRAALAGLEAAGLGEPELRDAFQACDWVLVPQRRYWLIGSAGEPRAYSVVRLVGAPALKSFRDRLAAVGGVDLPDLPPHVTLFTSNAGHGIGLASDRVFNALRLRRVDAGELGDAVR